MPLIIPPKIAAEVAALAPRLAIYSPQASEELVTYAACTLVQYPQHWGSVLYSLGDHEDSRVRDQAIEARSVIKAFVEAQKLGAVAQKAA